MKRGDKVKYIKTTKKGKGFSMSEKSGIFQDEIAEGMAEIKSSNGRMVHVKMSLVTPIKERNALTKALCPELGNEYDDIKATIEPLFEVKEIT
ncbi:MAG: hypothetical protein GY853_01230 [PVC group bacterium]|nr:hypothetical protein [PVC group bacterium]